MFKLNASLEFYTSLRTVSPESALLGCRHMLLTQLLARKKETTGVASKAKSWEADTCESYTLSVVFSSRDLLLRPRLGNQTASAVPRT